MINCKHCSNLPEKIFNKLFCSRSCSTSYNNSRRQPRTEESKNKTSDTIKNLIKEGKFHPSPKPVNRISEFPFTRLYGLYQCNSCKKEFWRKKYEQKCCSIECRDNIRSQNKCKKTHIKYFNKFENRYVDLQSTWELKIAQWMDLHNIVWSRPSKRIKWFCVQTQKFRTYLPDFFLENYNYFIDVKNPIKLETDRDKLLVVKSIIPLYVGNINSCIEFMARLAGLEPACIH